MKISEVRMYGVAHFAKEQRVELSTSPNKPITILHGENGAGKTSVLNCILWCLTGRLSLAWVARWGGSPTDFINKDIDEPEKDRFVEVRFEYEGAEYRAHRVASLQALEGDFNLYRRTAGTWDAFLNSSTAIMRNILPPGVAPYFIFDGEGFQQHRQEAGSTLAAVKTILGFDHVESACDRIGECLELAEKELNRLEQKAIKDDKKRRQFERATAQIDELKTKMSSKREEAKEVSEKLELAQEKISQTNDRLLSARYSEEANEKRNLTSHQLALSSYSSDKVKLISKYYRSVFGRVPLESGLSVIEAGRKKGVIPGKYSKQFIEDLKSEGTCMCGRPLGPTEINVLEEKSEAGFSDAFNNKLTEASACSKDDKRQEHEFTLELSKIHAGINDAQRQKATCEARLRELNEEIDVLLATKKEEEEWRNLERVCENKLLRINEDLTTCENDLAEAKRIRDASSGGAGDSDLGARSALKAEIQVLDELAKFAKGTLKAEFASAHSALQEKMKLAISGTNIPYGVRLTENFQFSFVDAHGGRRGGSTGEAKTLEYCYLCSLIELLKEKSKKTEGLLGSGSLIPLVLDAPFSELGQTHISYISDMLFEVSDQLVVLTFNKDWENFAPLCEGKIGTEYVVVKNVVGKSEGKLGEFFLHQGEKVPAVEYGADVSHTSFKRLL